MYKIALLIPAYNEELVIESTIKSAIEAGLPINDIYLVNDNSSDKTVELSMRYLPAKNILTVQRSGKSKAIKQARDHFNLCANYQWIHIADADGRFERNYFINLQNHLDISRPAATGYISSMPGSIFSTYRAYEYAIGMEISRRFQSIFGIIPVIPGPTSIFRNDIFARINFDSGTLCEDFDITLQLHRHGYGNIQFIPEARVLTQDPLTLKDYYHQILRWNRGVIQSMIRVNIGIKSQRIDFYIPLLVIQNLFVMIAYTIALPYVIWHTRSIEILSKVFLIDILIHFSSLIIVGIYIKRTDIIPAFVQLYLLKFLNLFAFTKSFFEVFLLGKFKPNSQKHWRKNTRYQIKTS